jgi:hypothetical protein
MYSEVCINISVFICNRVLDMQKHFEMNVSKQYDAQLFYISFLVVIQGILHCKSHIGIVEVIFSLK